MKPLKTQACWICSKKLWGNKFQLRFIDGYKRKVHILCAKKYDRNMEDENGSRNANAEL